VTEGLMARAHRSAVVKGPVDEVWAVVRPFDGLPAWQPLCPDTSIEGGESPDRVGVVRSIRQTDGAHFRERLLALSDLEHSQTYTLLDPPLSVTRMVTTLRLFPVTDLDGTYLSWSSQVDVGPADEKSFVDLLHRSFMIGIRHLQEMFDGADPTSART
jgi:hypothetical protein